MDYDMLIANLAGNAGGSNEVARRYATTIVKWMVKQVKEEGCLVINDFGKFLVNKHMEYVFLDASTKKRWLVPPRLSLSFKPAPLLVEDERDKGKVIPVITDVVVEQHQEKPIVARKYAVMFFKTILDAMEEEDPVTVEGLGSFLLKKVKVDDAVYGKVLFTPEESVLAEINRPFSYFQSVELNEGVDFDDVETTTHHYVEDKGEEVFLIFKEDACIPHSTAQTAAPSDSPALSNPSDSSDSSNTSLAADSSASSDLSDNPDTSTRRWRYVVAAVMLALCLAAFFFLRGGRQAPDVDEKEVKAMVEDQVSSENKTLPEDQETVSEKGSEASAPISEQPTLDYAKMNAQLPYCGYDIVGVASTITITPGLTLEEISRRYLGTDYTPYLVVLNDGNDNPQPGQQYLIPKLRLRKNK